MFSWIIATFGLSLRNERNRIGWGIELHLVHFILLLGGYNREECLRTVECYDPQKDCWTFIAPMRTPRARFQMAVLMVCVEWRATLLPTNILLLLIYQIMFRYFGDYWKACHPKQVLVAWEPCVGFFYMLRVILLQCGILPKFQESEQGH